jgi:hypothetical protein
MLAVTLLVPFNVTELGLTMQVDCAGAPLQVSATFWLKLFSGVTVIV